MALPAHMCQRSLFLQALGLKHCLPISSIACSYEAACWDMSARDCPPCSACPAWGRQSCGRQGCCPRQSRCGPGCWTAAACSPGTAARSAAPPCAPGLQLVLSSRCSPSSAVMMPSCWWDLSMLVSTACPTDRHLQGLMKSCLPAPALLLYYPGVQFGKTKAQAGCDIACSHREEFCTEQQGSRNHRRRILLTSCLVEHPPHASRKHGQADRKRPEKHPTRQHTPDQLTPASCTSHLKQR